MAGPESPEVSGDPAAASGEIRPAVNVEDLQEAGAGDIYDQAAPRSESSNDRPDPEVDRLEDSRTKLGRARTQAARSFRDKEGVTLLENDPEELKDNPAGYTELEREYYAATREAIINKVDELKDLPPEEIRQQLAIFMEAEQTRRLMAEFEARNNPNTRLGKIRARTTNWIRNHPKLRLATQIALAGGAIVLTASGFGGVAIGMVVGRAALSGAGLTVGLKDHLDMRSERNDSKGRWWRNRRLGKAAKVAATHGGTAGLAAGAAAVGARALAEHNETQQLENLTDDQRLKQITRILAAQARHARSLEQVESKLESNPTLNKLRHLEREAIERRLEAASDTLDALEQRMREQLVAERKQLISDKKANRRRTFIAVTAGTALATVGLVTGVDHIVASMDHVGHAVGSGVGTAVEHSGSAAAASSEHASNFMHYPEIVTDQVDKGDTPVRVAMKHLSRVQGWSHFTADQQHEKIMHLANQMKKVGGHWRFTREAMAGSFNFDHGAVHIPSGTEHVMPGSNGAPLPSSPEQVLHIGDQVAPAAHEMTGAVNYPEIVTQPIHWGDTTTGVARLHLSKLPGWSAFSPSEQHEKVLHFANQITRDGNHWRYTKEAIDASFNFKR